jgi:lysyl-tRNA synthetase class I
LKISKIKYSNHYNERIWCNADELGFEPLALPSTELFNGNPFAMEIVSSGIEI